jgi:hypothetical protein
MSEWCREQLLADYHGAEPRRAVTAQTDTAGFDDRDTPKAARPMVTPSNTRREKSSSAEMPTAPTPLICANCEHPKSKHHGFKSACQADTCLCGSFE